MTQALYYFILGALIGIVPLLFVVKMIITLDNSLSQVKEELFYYKIKTNKAIEDTEIGLQDLEEQVDTLYKIQNILIESTINVLEKLQPKTKSNVKKESGKKSTTKKV